MAETGNWSPYYITDAGRALRQLSIAEGKQMVFTRAVIGTGKPADPATIDEMSGLVAFAKDVIIKRSYAIEANHLIVVRVDNSGYTQDVLMTEIGVYAKIDDQEDNQAILYGYAYSLDGYVLIPAQTSNTNRKIYEITLDTYLSRSSDIQIVFDSSTIFVSHADLDDAVESIDATIESLDASQIGLELEAFPGANTIAAAFTEVASQMANMVDESPLAELVATTRISRETAALFGVPVEEGSSPVTDTVFRGAAQQISNRATKSTLRSDTFFAAEWSGEEVPYQYTLTLFGVSSTAAVELLPGIEIGLEELTAYQLANLQDGGQSESTLVFNAWGEKPELDIPIRVLIRGDM